MGYAVEAAGRAIEAAHRRHGIEFICQDDTLEIVMGPSFYADLCREEPASASARNVLCVPIRVDEGMDGFAVAKREGTR